MTVASVDYPNKRIYLDATTISGEFDTLDVYREVRALRRTNDDHRKFEPMVVAGGNIQKTPTTYTPAYVRLLYGCRLVPYDTSHSLKLIRETFTDDAKIGRDCFDRSPLSPTVEVDIDYDVQEVEIRLITTGGSALTEEEHDFLMSLVCEARLQDLLFNRSNTITGTGTTKRISAYKAGTVAGGGEVDVSVTYDSGGEYALPASEEVVE